MHLLTHWIIGLSVISLVVGWFYGFGRLTVLVIFGEWDVEGDLGMVFGFGLVGTLLFALLSVGAIYLGQWIEGIFGIARLP